MDWALYGFSGSCGLEISWLSLLWLYKTTTVLENLNSQGSIFSDFGGGSLKIYSWYSGPFLVMATPLQKWVGVPEPSFSPSTFSLKSWNHIIISIGKFPTMKVLLGHILFINRGIAARLQLKSHLSCKAMQLNNGKWRKTFSCLGRVCAKPVYFVFTWNEKARER